MIMFAKPKLNKILRFSGTSDSYIVRYVFFWDESKGENIFCMEYEKNEYGDEKLGILFKDAKYGEIIRDDGGIEVNCIPGTGDDVVKRLKLLDSEIKKIKGYLEGSVIDLLEAVVSS